MSDELEINIEKQIVYWREGALEAMDTASYLIKGGRISLGLFAAHLALEKILKAHVCRKKQNTPPRIHNLTRLAELAELTLSDDHKASLAAMNEFQLEGRYPDMLMPPPTLDETKKYLERSKAVFEWLINQ